MERKVNLERLPPEVLWHIGMFLRVPDLTACCGVSSTMRQAFSDDLVWKRHCDLELVQYLNETECSVEPSLEWTELWYQSSLYPLPRWRSAYMKHMHFVKNWREGRFEKEEIQLGEEGSTYSDLQVLFYRNDNLFVHAYSCTQGMLLDEVWNVRDSPFLHSTLNLHKCLINDHSDDLLEVHTFTKMGDKLVVGQHNLVLVFDIDLGNFSQPALDKAFLVNNSEDFSKTALGIVNNSVHRNSFFQITPEIEVLTYDSLFIAALTSPESLADPKLHIWDVSKGSKLKEESIPRCDGVIAELGFIQNCYDFVIKLRVTKHRYMYHYYGYNATTLSYTKFSVKLNYCDFVTFASDYLVGVSPRQIILYSYSNSEKVFTKKCDHEILKRTVAVVGDDLLFGTFDSVVYLVNLASLTVVNSIRLGFTLYSLTPIFDRFVLINSNHGEVWEIGKNVRKLFSFPMDGSVVAVNKYYSKIAISKGNKIVIVNFW